jgi:hypothetical protein
MAQTLHGGVFQEHCDSFGNLIMLVLDFDARVTEAIEAARVSQSPCSCAS